MIGGVIYQLVVQYYYVTNFKFNCAHLGTGKVQNLYFVLQYGKITQILKGAWGKIILAHYTAQLSCDATTAALLAGCPQPHSDSAHIVISRTLC